MLENRTLEVIIIAAVVLLLFGAKRLPDAARGLGKSLRIFKSEVSAMKTDGAASAAGVPRSVAAGPTEADADHGVSEPTSLIRS
ncbi:Sec-independent protein translocase subunit TatA [Streptomyces sp. NPDC007189]|uniref:Sec-independent protein translocase subunit TatA n=1 Tax=unclassified Streptomyces TaxID=2593676 RepID=UPI0033C1FC4D